MVLGIGVCNPCVDWRQLPTGTPKLFPRPLHGKIKVVCLSYLRGLVSRMSDYEEGRVMPHVRSAGTAACLAEMLHANHRHLGAEALATGAEALAYICDTEDFVTHRVRTRVADE